jgi:carboxyl-terminal processing protease
MRNVSQVLVTALLVALAFGAGWFGNVFASRNFTAPGTDPQLQSIIQAYNAISNQYVDPSAISHQKMAYAAIGAMVDSLGDTGHSRFETPQEIQAENRSLQNQPTVGIGVQLSGGGSAPLRVDEVFPNSAADGTLKPGDLILAVNGTDVSGMTFDQVRPLIVGDTGTWVSLTIQRPGLALPLDVSLLRQPYTVPLVASYLIPGSNLVDIQLTQFGEDSNNPQDSTDAELRKAIKDAQSKGAKGIVLDLRDNPGGYLDQAVLVASEFIPAGHGKNVFIQRTRTSQTPQPVQAGGLATTSPLTVLVNGNTASAAEIVTAAIMYNRPAVHVVGVHTFGTDTILTPVPLANGGEVLLGTQGWLTPGGQNVRATGVVPDQVVALPDGVAEVTPLVMSESQLTLTQIQAGKDAQLKQAITNLAA